jgi:hypothetical protein
MAADLVSCAGRGTVRLDIWLRVFGWRCRDILERYNPAPFTPWQVTPATAVTNVARVNF